MQPHHRTHARGGHGIGGLEVRKNISLNSSRNRESLQVLYESQKTNTDRTDERVLVILRRTQGSGDPEERVQARAIWPISNPSDPCKSVQSVFSLWCCFQQLAAVLVNDSALHHENHAPDRCDVGPRISVEGDDVCLHSRCQRANLLVHTHGFRCM